jgi:predicted DNA-binding protein (MmcQ/YjbR family)
MAACGATPGSVEDYPFGDEVAVFKVAGRMFALVSLGPAPGSVSLKCDPGPAAGPARPLWGYHPGLPPQQAALEHHDAGRFGA